jgi:hypothetical protein
MPEICKFSANKIEGAANPCNTGQYKLSAVPCTWGRLSDFPYMETDTDRGTDTDKDKDKDMDNNTTPDNFQ